MGFSSDLLEIASAFDMRTNPFVRGVLERRYRLEALRPYAIDLFTLGRHFQGLLAQIIAATESRSVRLALLENLLEEMGVTSFDLTRGIAAQADLDHPELLRGFARALGVTDAELDLAPVQDATWLREALADGQWLGPLAFLTVGYEACVPATFGLLVEGFRGYGLDDEEIVFFIEHVEADQRHAEIGARMVAGCAKTKLLKKEARDGVRRGCLAWWALHRRAHRNALAC